MAWTTPTTRVTGELITAAIWNTDIKANLDYLFARPLADTIYNVPSALQTNSTSFVDVDATNIIATFTTAAARIIAIASFLGSKATSTAGLWDLILDSTTRAGHSTGGLGRLVTGAASHIMIAGKWDSVSAASHTIKLQQRSEDANNVSVLPGVAHILVWEG